MMTVADRRRNNAYIANNQTGGSFRQEFHYFVLGIGDDHRLPSYIEKDVGVVKINFGQMSELDKQQFQGMFISGHGGIDERPIVAYGNTLVKISGDSQKQVKETTFIRADGTELKETIRLDDDDIFAALPDINRIFDALGLRFIEYLRFIGGDFQADMLKSRDVKKTAAAFHSLFPSEHFPELKIPLKKIPLTAAYVEVRPFDVNSLQYGDKLHKACKELDLEKCRLALEGVDIDVLDSDLRTPLQSLLCNYQSFYKSKALKDRFKSFFDILTLLLENGADINKPYFVADSAFNAMSGNTLIAVVISKEDPELVDTLMRGSQHPDCPSIRTFPIIGLKLIDHLLGPFSFCRGLSNFQRFYPFFRYFFHLIS